MTLVFISYTPQDSAPAAKIAEALTAAGLSLWDNRAVAVGEDMRAALQRGLDSATHGLVLLSPALVRSAWAKREYMHFLNHNKPLVLALVRPLDDDDVPYALRHLSCIDLTDDFEANLPRLVEAVRANQPDFAAQGVEVSQVVTRSSQVTVTLEVEEDTDSQKVVDLINRLTQIGIKDIKVVNSGARR